MFSESVSSPRKHNPSSGSPPSKIARAMSGKKKVTRRANRANNATNAPPPETIKAVKAPTDVDDDDSPDPVRAVGLAAIMRAVAAGCEEDVESVYKQYGDRILDMADKVSVVGHRQPC